MCIRDRYHAASDEYKKALELQNFDLVNAERVQFGLPTLAYNERVSETARKHSQDLSLIHISLKFHNLEVLTKDEAKQKNISYQSLMEENIKTLDKALNK